MQPAFILSCAALLLFAASPGVSGFWRTLCHGTLGVAQIDPVVNFGQVSPHAHFIAGASNFGVFSDTADLIASNCTSCDVTEDKSAYWTPALYFQHDNGSYELVQTSGGMTVYYFNNNNFAYGNPTGPLTAFPPDFRMVAGNTSLRDFPYPVPDPETSNWEPSDMTQAALAAKAIAFTCMDYRTGAIAEGALEVHYLRNKTFLDAQCPDGVRFEVEFPSCWDGVRLDSEDHKSHILYPNFIKTGLCPAGFNVRTPVIFYETIWNTFDFVNQSGIFVIANGDTEGYGYHGDFYSGWNQSFLQEAVDTCNDGSGLVQDCGMFTLQDDSVSTSCSLEMPEELRQEDYQGPLSTLPGNVPICTGPQLAVKLEGTPVTGSTKPPAPTALPSGSTFAQGVSGAASATTTVPVISSVPSPTSATPVASSTSSAQISGSVSTPGNPAITAAPSSDVTQPLSILTTSTFTSDGEEVRLIIFEDVVTVTDTVGPGKRRRHSHANGHARRHR